MGGEVLYCIARTSMAAGVLATRMPRTEQAPDASGSLRMSRSVGDSAITRKII